MWPSLSARGFETILRYLPNLSHNAANLSVCATRPRGRAKGMPPPRAVAACFSGGQGRAVPDGGESIRRYLIRPLKADVLLALGYSDRDGCGLC